MNRNRRNILIAVLLLLFLLLTPFWGRIKTALGMEDARSGASPESSVKTEAMKSLSSENT